jgi:hypothetical protein
MSSKHPRHVHKGRGATLNPANRYVDTARADIDDGWGNLEAPLPAPATTLYRHQPHGDRHNDSPDVGFDRSINPLPRLLHGCAYCFARPTHARGLARPASIPKQVGLQNRMLPPSLNASWPRVLIIAPPSRSASTPMPISRANANWV